MSVATLPPVPAMSMAQLRRTVQMRERVAEACGLVASRPSIRGVHIVTRDQPAPDELQRYRACATLSHAALTVDAHGMISIRPGAGEEM